jgi:hypothetical protein
LLAASLASGKSPGIGFDDPDEQPAARIKETTVMKFILLFTLHLESIH